MTLHLIPRTLHLALFFLLAACSTLGGTGIPQAVADVERQAAPPADDLAALVEGNTEFAFDLYRQLAAEGDGNLIFSPYSISLAFAMLYAGAKGDTAAQMADTLHYTLPPEQLHPAFNALDLALQPPPAEQPTPPSLPEGYEGADDLTLNIANRLWGQQGLPFEPTYLETLGLHYGAGVGLVDFSADPGGAQQTISRWVEQETAGRIRNMPPPEAITPLTRLVLANAIYFKAEWTFPFSTGETHDATFHLLDGSDVTIPMMVNDFAVMRCRRADNYYAIDLAYGVSESAAMLILLPDTASLREFESGLDAGVFRAALALLQTTNGLTFSLPRFNFESEFDLSQTLSTMGLTTPFGGGADFTGISSSGLFIDYAAHKAIISVDELGTEAAGVTIAGMLTSGIISDCQGQVTADHPFIFAIYDRDTSAILFLGRVMNPAA